MPLLFVEAFCFVLKPRHTLLEIAMNNISHLNFIMRPLFLSPYFLAVFLHNTYAADKNPIDRLPAILADICRKTPDGYDEKQLIKCMFQDAKVTPKLIETKVFVILHKLDPQNNYIFPGTVLRLLQECWDVCQGKPAPSQPYDKAAEIAYGTAVMNLFPSELRKVCDMEKYVTKKLVACAYILGNMPRNEDEINSITKFENIKICDIPNLIERCIYCKFQNNRPLAKQLTSDFIEFFSTVASRATINQCREDILKNCCIAMHERASTLKSFETKYTELVSTAKSGGFEVQRTLCNPQFILKELQNALPKCPVCFYFFSDQFTNESNGSAYTTSCNHIICNACIGTCNSICPVCRLPLLPPKIVTGHCVGNLYKY
jgi:hypothetical protein